MASSRFQKGGFSTNQAMIGRYLLFNIMSLSQVVSQRSPEGQISYLKNKNILAVT
jgi:hypothetical protein